MKRTADFPWLEPELDELRRLLADDVSIRLSAVKLNRTQQAVEAKIAELRTFVVRD